MATYAVPAMGDVERVVLAVDAAGDVSVFTGTQSSGQGHESVFARILAEELSIDVNRVRVLQGDTRKFESDSMTAGSRTIPAGVPACRKAALALIRRGREIAAELIQSEPDDISYADGIFRSLKTDAEFSLGDLALAATDADLICKDDDPSLCVEATHNPGDFTAPCGTHVCEVEIDQATGQVRLVRYTSVDDIGAVADQALASAQIHGGVAQGLGQALLETSTYDEESGQLLTGSMMDYVMPRADDLPNISTMFMECNHSDRLHGVGEMGTIASTPAIMNAVMDALHRIGVDEIDAPLTPEKIWRACKQSDPG